MEIQQEDLLDIKLTLGRCKDYFERHENSIDSQNKDIRELQQTVTRLNAKLEQLLSSQSQAENTANTITQLGADVRQLIEWQRRATSRMDVLSNSLWGAVVTGIVGFIGLTIMTFLNRQSTTTTKHSALLDHPQPAIISSRLMKTK